MPSKMREIRCPICGKMFYRRESDIKRAEKRSGTWKCKSCTLKERNMKNQKPIGSKRKNCKGYIQIKTEKGWVFEHRHVYEEATGRELGSKEIIHHLNGDITDNRIENIAVMVEGAHTQHHHRGSKRDEVVVSKISASKKGKSVSVKLSEYQVMEIREKHANCGKSYSELAKQYKVSKGMIGHIVRGAVWRDVA